MKQILLVLTVLYTLNSVGQDPQLFDNEWYLHSLVVSDVAYTPPSNAEAPYVLLQFVGNDYFDTGGCNSLGGTISYNSILPEFTSLFLKLMKVI